MNSNTYFRLYTAVLAIFVLTFAGQCFHLDPVTPICLDLGKCETAVAISHPDSSVELIVQLYPGLDVFDVLGPTDTVYKILDKGGEPFYRWDTLSVGLPIIDTVIIGQTALLKDLNAFLYDGLISPISSVMPVDTCKCDEAIFLMRASVPPGTSINSGIAAGTTKTRKNNKGSILAAGFNYEIELKPFNDKTLSDAKPDKGDECGELKKYYGEVPGEIDLSPESNPSDVPCRTTPFTPQQPGRYVKVAIVDTGVDPTYRYPNDPSGDLSAYFSFTQEMLAINGSGISSMYGEAWPGNGIDENGNCFANDYYGYDFFHGDNNPADIQGHGTHMAYTILTANDAAVDPVRLMPLQFGGMENGDFACDLFAGICAISYATNKKTRADVINLSWGFYSDIFHDVLYEQMLKAKSVNAIVITSAGNDYVLVDSCAHWPSGFSAVDTLYDNVISVAALEQFSQPGNYVLANYSNYGISIDLAAPGTQVLGALAGSLNGDIRLDGTSMAAAVVSRRASMLVYAGGVRRSAEAIKNQILSETLPMNNACVGNRRAMDVTQDPTLLPAIGY